MRDHPFLNIDPYRDLLEEIAPLRNLSPGETAWMVGAVCASAMSIANAQADREAVLQFQDPVPPESRALWLTLRSDLPARGWGR